VNATPQQSGAVVPRASAHSESGGSLTGSLVTSDVKSNLSMLWIFYMFNTAYIDITTLYYRVFVNHAPTVHYTQAFLLGAAVLVEIPMLMVVLSRVLRNRASRSVNIAVGALLTVVQVATLFVGTPTLSCLFISIALIGTDAVIIWSAWKWTDVPTTLAEPISEIAIAPTKAAP
jgi:hypothetical protein